MDENPLFGLNDLEGFFGCDVGHFLMDSKMFFATKLKNGLMWPEVDNNHSLGPGEVIGCLDKTGGHLYPEPVSTF